VAFPTRSLVAATLIAAAAGFSSFASPAGPDPGSLLREARRSLREDGDGSSLTALGRRSSLWEARVSLARAANGDSSGPPAGPALGIPGVDAWLALRNDPKTDAAALARFAATLPPSPLAVEATGEASSRLRTPSERPAVRDAAARLLASGPSGPRERTVLLLARLRTEKDDAGRRAAMGELVSAVPDAPERDPAQFRADEAILFRAAALQAPLRARIARAKAVLGIHPDESAALVQRVAEGAPPEEALAAAELLLATGRALECERMLAPLGRGEPGTVAESARALSTAASLQRLSGSRPHGGKHSRSSARTTRSARVKGARAPVPKGELDRCLREAEGHLARELRPSVRQRLLSELLRAGRAADRPDVVRSAALRLSEADPGGTAGSEDLFQAAFAGYRTRDPGLVRESARGFGEIAARYQNVSVRRRAVYWEARALQKAEDPAARALFASLLPSTSPDLYGRWSADSLGVDPTPAPPLAAEAWPVEDAPAAASREYLAAGLDGLAELAAEAEGSLDRPFAARIASERRDFRRVASGLKGLHPALGTPEEGGVPLDERKLFYPVAHLRILKEAGRQAGVSPALLCGLIRQESLFQDRIVSRAGAVGLMQVMPATGKLLLRREGGRGRPDLSAPAENIRLGSQFLGRLLVLFEGDVVAALVAYNAGPSRALRWKKENADLAPDEWVEAIPFAETRDYVKRVLFFSGAYAALYDLPDPPGSSRLTAGDAGVPGIRPAVAPVGPSRPSGGR